MSDYDFEQSKWDSLKTIILIIIVGFSISLAIVATIVFSMVLP